MLGQRGKNGLLLKVLQLKRVSLNKIGQLSLNTFGQLSVVLTVKSCQEFSLTGGKVALRNSFLTIAIKKLPKSYGGKVGQKQQKESRITD